MAEPIFKYAGGKRWLAPILAPRVDAHLVVTQGRYVEPFLGGGAVALAVGAPHRPHLLADTLVPLIETYQMIVANPDGVARRMHELAEWGTDEASYYEIRSEVPTDPEAQAARWIYLNRYGYNGLWRTNQAGAFNVPYGDGRGRLPFSKELVDLATCWAWAEIVAADFAATIRQAQDGDVIYADPPYAGTSFVGYAAEGFTMLDHEWLAYELHCAAQRGALVFATNADLPEVRRLYAWAGRIMRTAERRAINRDGAGRERVPCVLIASDAAALALAGEVVASAS